jgi:tuftelin-interacting protein 11
MARKKRLLDDGDDSDSTVSLDADRDLDNDPDVRDERELFENPYRKRRRKNGEDESEPSRAPTPSFPSFVGASRGGIGSKTSDAVPSLTDSGPSTSTRNSPTPAPIPSAFSNRSQSFMRDAQPSVKPVALSTSEMAHFNKLQNTFGAKMLAKMGWKAGTGLGVSGEGIATPIEGRLRPQKMGIAFKGFQEKTEQSKKEARRRGEVVSDDEDEKTKSMKKKVKEAEQKRSESWKRPKKVKTKIEHKTYEEILAEAGEAATVTGIGQIIDARGPVVSVWCFHTRSTQ